MLKTQLSTTDIPGDILNYLHIDRNFIRIKKSNVTASIDNEERPIPLTTDDKLHRRNPVAVRLDIKSFDDVVPETTLADLQLSEMPGLQNTEQWKRIAGRIVQASPPLSREYFQTASRIFDSQDGHIPDMLGSYRRPGRTENEQESPPVVTRLLHTPRRKILFGLSIACITIAITIAIVVAVILVRKPVQKTTDSYSGSIFVQAPYDPVLSSLSSTLAINYKSEFCTLISTTLIDLKTKYAIFYSTCNVNSFRNGSIIANFILGFTRYQNVTRLNGFLNRTLINKQLFGGTIFSIYFNSSTSIDTYNTDYDSNATDYDNNSADYEINYNNQQSTKLLSINEQVVLTPLEITTKFSELNNNSTESTN